MHLINFNSDSIQSKDKILFLGELPQNVIHGISISNSINIELLKKKFLVFIIEELSKIETNSTFKLPQIIHFFHRVFSLLRYSVFYNFKYFYLILSLSSLGLLKTYISILSFKIFNPSAKIIVHIHRSDFVFSGASSKFKKYLFKIILKCASKVIVISRGAQKYFYFEYGQSCDVVILKNTVRWCEENRLSKFYGNGTNFVFISNYFKEKGIIILLNAIKSFEFNVFLSCYGKIGDASIIPYLSSLNENNIVINGPITGLEKYKVLNNADALILPSFNEGAPLIILEAMMLGVPIITYDVGFIREMLYDNYPLIYSGDNTESNLKFKLNYFMNLSAEDRISISNKLKLHFSENYSIQKHEIDLFKIFH